MTDNPTPSDQRLTAAPEGDVAALIAEARACPFEDACSDEELVKRLCTALEASEAGRVAFGERLERVVRTYDRDRLDSARQLTATRERIGELEQEIEMVAAPTHARRILGEALYPGLNGDSPKGKPNTLWAFAGDAVALIEQLRAEQDALEYQYAGSRIKRAAIIARNDEIDNLQQQVWRLHAERDALKQANSDLAAAAIADNYTIMLKRQQLAAAQEWIGELDSLRQGYYDEAVEGWAKCHETEREVKQLRAALAPFMAVAVKITHSYIGLTERDYPTLEQWRALTTIAEVKVESSPDEGAPQVNDLTTQLATAREVALARVIVERDEAKRELAKLKGRYPHTCRDDHDEIRWSGDGELCPVCLAMSDKCMDDDTIDQLRRGQNLGIILELSGTTAGGQCPPDTVNATYEGGGTIKRPPLDDEDSK